MGSLERLISFSLIHSTGLFAELSLYNFNMGFSSAMLPRVLFLLLLLVFCSSGAEVVTVDVHAAKDFIKSGYKYLDVRAVEEYKKGHVGADKIFNIPYMFITPEGRVKNSQFLEEVSSACNKEDHLIVGCQSGVRSLYATSDLLTAGFKDVRNMGGGYLAWVESGYPVQKPGAENVSLLPKPEAEL